MFKSSIGDKDMNNQEFIEHYGAKYNEPLDSSKLKISDLKGSLKNPLKRKIPKPPSTRRTRQNRMKFRKNPPNYLNDTQSSQRNKHRNSSLKSQSKKIIII